MSRDATIADVIMDGRFRRGPDPRRLAGQFRATHGMKRTPEYRAWCGMVERCENPNNKKFKNYGARGIAVCERWRHDFVAFFADVGPRPSPEHSVDRNDVNGNYEPGNVRWATRIEQARNQTTSRLLEHRGIRLCVAEWAERLGIARGTILQRLHRGWGTEKTLTQPVSDRGQQ